MKYYFISDVHGQYNKMVKALQEAHFDATEDTLVSLGDLFDRGPDSKKVLEYVMSCPNRILLWGNHDARLKAILLNEPSNSYDVSNGVPETLQSFCNLPKKPAISWGLQVFKSDSQYQNVRELLWKYFDECHWCAEFSDLIAVHAWIPCVMDFERYGFQKIPIYYYYSYWREADKEMWYDTSWANTAEIIKSTAYPEKDMIVGHWHAWRIAHANGQPRYKQTEYTMWARGIVDQFVCNCDSYTYKASNGRQVTLIDGCSNLPSGQVNVYVKETEEIPILIC